MESVTVCEESLQVMTGCSGSGSYSASWNDDLIVSGTRPPLVIPGSDYPSTDTKYSDVFIENVDASLTNSGCSAVKQCYTTSSCNKSNGWYDSAASANPTNTSNVYAATSYRGYGTSNVRKTCYKAKNQVYFHVDYCRTTPPLPQSNYFQYSFRFMLTDSETNTSQFTTTSVFASSESVGTVYTKLQGLSRTYPPITVSSDDLGLSSSDENMTTWKTVTKDIVYYNSDSSSSSPTPAYSNDVAFNGTNDKVKYVLHGSCLKENACENIPLLGAGIEYAETVPSKTGFSFSYIQPTTDCYTVGCADGYTSDISKAISTTALTYTGASGTTYKCYQSNPCSSGYEFSGTTPSETGFTFVRETTTPPSNCYTVSCASGYTSDASAGTGTALTYTGTSGTEYKCYKSAEDNSKYFNVTSILSSSAPGCTISSGYYVAVPSWSISETATSITADSSKRPTLVSVAGKTCSSSSYVRVALIPTTLERCTGSIDAPNATIGAPNPIGYSASYYVNCSSDSCCIYSGTEVATRSYACDVGNGYVSSLATPTSTTTVSVCGATLKSGSSYSFTYKTSAGEYTKTLTVNIHTHKNLLDDLDVSDLLM
jgi:hypothetical protein